MPELTDELVRVHAYRLWERAGSPDKDPSDFWHQAKSELESDALGDEDLKPQSTGPDDNTENESVNVPAQPIEKNEAILSDRVAGTAKQFVAEVIGDGELAEEGHRQTKP